MPRYCKTCQINIAPIRKRLCDECRTLCAKCHQHPRMARHQYCLGCKSAQTKTSRLNASESARRRQIASSYVSVYLKRGKIQRGPCEAHGCTERKTFAFHPDTSKPLEVVWLCRRHARIAQMAQAQGDDPF